MLGSILDRPSEDRFARWIRRLAIPATLALLSTTLALAPVDAAPAYAADPAASTVVVGLLRLSTALGAAATQPVLATDLPLTDVSVRDVLSLDTALGQRVADAVLASTDDPTLATLPEIISADSALTMTQVPSLLDAPVGSTEWELDLDLPGVVPVPLRYQDERLEFGAAQLTGELAASLTGTIRLRYDPSALLLRQFSVVGESLLTTHAWSRAVGGTQATGQQVTIPSFPIVDGFVEIVGAGVATIDTTSTLRLRDPNGRGALTTEDLQFGTPEELFALLSGPGDDDVHVDITLRSALLDTAGHGSVSVGTRPPSSADPYAPVVLARDAQLDRLTSLTRAQAVAGFAQFTAAVLAAESSVDAEIPLLDAKLTDLFSPGDDLLTLLSTQAVATITCGAADTAPPTGAPRPGQVRYCQAVTDGMTVDAGTVPVWSSPEAGVSFGPGDGTVGTSPSANVTVTGGGGFPKLVVDFVSDGEARTARSLVRSIQELGATVAGVGLGGTVTYNPANESLEIATSVAVPDTTIDVATGGTGSLAPLTGLAGLCQAASASTPRACPRTGDQGPAGTTARTEPEVGQARLDAGGRQLSATFGIGLVPPAPPAVDGADAPPEPVVYLKPAPDGVLWQIGSVSTTLPQDAPLVARIGFLQVDVDVEDYTLSSTGTAARVTVPTGPVTLAGGVASGAVSILSLLGADPDQNGGVPPVATTATRGLSATAHLLVRDAPGATTPRPLAVSGTIDAVWDDLSPGQLPTVTTGGDYDQLRLLDLVPSQRGEAGAGSAGATLFDPIADFEVAFGVDPLATAGANRIVSRTLHDLDAPRDTDEASDAGTTCTEFEVVDADELRCTEGPLAAGGFDVGHAYVIEGDPTALRDVLIEDIAAVLSVYATPEAGLNASDTLPLIDLRPDQISGAHDALSVVAATLQAEAAADTGTSDVSTLQGFAAAVQRVAGLGSITDLSLEGTDLQLRTSFSQTAPPLYAPLHVSVGTRMLNIVDGVDDAGLPATVTLPLQTSSSIDLRIAVDLHEGSSRIGRDTELAAHITGLSSADAQVKQSLADKDAEYGGTIAKTTATAADISAGIALDVSTTPAATSDPWIPLPDFRVSLEHTRSQRDAPQTCDGAVSDPAIAACLSVPLVNGTTALTTVTVGLRADESSGGTGAALDAQPLAHRFLGDGLAAFTRTLTDALDGDITDTSLPLVGTDLDAGADIPAAVNAYAGAVRLALASVAAADTVLATTYQSQLSAAITAVDVPDVVDDAVVVSLKCGTTPCSAIDTVADVDEITAPVHLSGDKAGETAPFRAGLAGVPLDTNLTVPTATAWDLTTTIGIRRGSGPFILAVPSGAATTVGVLTETVTAELPDYSTDVCHAWDRATLSKAAAANSIPASQDPASQCIDAFVGSLPSVLVDLGGSGLNATLTLEVTPGAGGAGPADAAGRVYLPALFDRLLPTTTTIDGTGALDLYFESFASDIGFFDVVGTIGQTWTSDAAGGGSYTDLAFGSLQLDAQTVYELLDIGYAKAKKYLAPLNPVADVLSAPIPVATELAGLVGEPPVTLLYLLARANQKLAMILNLVSFQQLIARLPGAGTAPELIDLGTGTGSNFKLPPLSLRRTSCTKTVAATKSGGKAFTAKTTGTGVSNRCDEGAVSKIKRKKNGVKAPKDPTAGKNIQKQTTKSTYFALPTISIPVLEDAQQVYDLLLGAGDTTLLYVDLGHIGGEVSMVRNFGPLMIGPVPVVASIGGSIGIDGRFAFGFDTHGLTKAIETLDEPGDVRSLTGFSRGEVFSEGFFIDDLEKGVDVPEIKLSFTIQAGASVSIGFADAGIRGGVVLDLSLDAFDPDGDGKIYTDEFFGADTGADCLFNVSSGITFFLQFYFHIDLFLFHVDKSFDIIRSPRIVLFEFNCDLTPPTLAYLEGNDLWLTMGTKSAHRNAYQLTTKESYTVRQLGPAYAEDTTTVVGTLVEVSAFSLVQTFTVPLGGRIRAEADDNADVVRLYPGQIPTTDIAGATIVTTVPFTIASEIDGGAGDDKITTGDGPDVVRGGGDNDSISAGGGDDNVSGGPGRDLIDGQRGHDVLDGGDDEDRISGGPGGDLLTGGSQDDVLDGGPGALPSQLFPTTDPAVIGALLDSGDFVIGGSGSDTITGGDGSDSVVGGSYDATGARFDGVQTSSVFGVTPTGKLQAVNVSTPTLVLPSLTAARAECEASGGSAGPDRDNVTGGNARDFVIGGNGDDTLSGGGGDDLVCGRSGDDLLLGDGSDVVPADAGADEIRGGPGADRLYGAGLGDTLLGDAGDDLLRGGDGDDWLRGGPDVDLLLGEAGADRLEGDGYGTSSTVLGDARAIICLPTTSVVLGGIDLNGDLAANSLDLGRLEGLAVTDGIVYDVTGDRYSGLLGDVVFQNGLADLDGNGVTDDTGAVELAGLTGAVGDGDCLLGGEDADISLDGQLGGDWVDGGDGDDPVVRGGPGFDLVRGGAGDDVVRGDDGNDLLTGDGGDDLLIGNAGDDVLRGGSDDDRLIGGSEIAGATDGRDELLGDGGDDVLAGGNATMSAGDFPTSAIAGRMVTLLATPASAPPLPGQLYDDQLFGGFGVDWAFGQEGDDLVRGGHDDDVVEGGPGADLVQGDDGHDLAVGGSSTGGAVTLDRSGQGIADGADTVHGDAGVDGLDGVDIVAGDNARLDPPSATSPVNRTRWARIRPTVGIVLFDLAATVSPSTTTSGDDHLTGGDEDDLLIGQSGDDTIEGGDGNDAVEGNAGDDIVTGGPGADELVGGSWTAGAYDVSVTFDDLDGGPGDDILLGDNGSITAPVSPEDEPLVRLHDVPVVGAGVSATSAGDDHLTGDIGDDRLYGQSRKDVLAGDDDVDELEGGDGNDTLTGGDDDDTLVGGSSAVDGVIVDARVGNGLPDGNDVLRGGQGDDVLAGDNARLLAVPGEFRADGTALRTIRLFDVETSGSSAAGAGDTLSGDSGRDLLFGQGGPDVVSGGNDDDVAEGNAGADTIVGGGGEDDLVGGGSATNGVVISRSFGTVTDRLLTAPSGVVDTSAAGLLDDDDTLYGGDGPFGSVTGQADGADVLLGDNGRVTRDITTIAGGGSGVHAVRHVAMADAAPGGTSGSDRLEGEAGDDELYGQFDDTGSTGGQTQGGVPVKGDVLVGGPGDDALVGDQGVDVPTPAADLGDVDKRLTDAGNFLDELVRPGGTLVRVVTLTQPGVGGDDVLLGGSGRDSVHAGAGNDLANAGDGDDVVFGGNGSDALWGGLDHDLLFGGAGADFLDIKKRVDDPALWTVVAPIEDTDDLKATVNGRDTTYGGTGPDAAQADVGNQGKIVGDRLVDWKGVFNLYLVCAGAYGAGKVQKRPSPSTTSLLQELARSMGSVGDGELALSLRGESSPKYPGAPGNFSCETG